MVKFQQSLLTKSGKVNGYPLFLDSTPNVQTRVVESKNVMKIALKRYEDNLRKAQQSEDD